MAGSPRVGAVVRRKVGTVLRLPWTTRVEYAVVVALALGAEIGIRVLPLERMARLYGVSFGRSGGLDGAPLLDGLPAWARRRVRIVNTVMRRWPVDGMCLRRSLVVGQRLRSLSPDLRLGVARRGGAITAHAWLEIDGRSLDPSSAAYDVLPSVQ